MLRCRSLRARVYAANKVQHYIPVEPWLGGRCTAADGVGRPAAAAAAAVAVAAAAYPKHTHTHILAAEAITGRGVRVLHIMVEPCAAQRDTFWPVRTATSIFMGHITL